MKYYPFTPEQTVRFIARSHGLEPHEVRSHKKALSDCITALRKIIVTEEAGMYFIPEKSYMLPVVRIAELCSVHATTVYDYKRAANDNH